MLKRNKILIMILALCMFSFIVYATVVQNDSSVVINSTSSENYVEYQTNVSDRYIPLSLGWTNFTYSSLDARNYPLQDIYFTDGTTEYNITLAVDNGWIVGATPNSIIRFWDEDLSGWDSVSFNDNLQNNTLYSVNSNQAGITLIFKDVSTIDVTNGETVYLKIPKYANVTSATFNITK